MLKFQIINCRSEIDIRRYPFESTNYKWLNVVIDEHGDTVDPITYKGKQYHLISKRERDFTGGERAYRCFLGVLALVCTLGFGIFKKSIRKFFTQKREKIRYAFVYNSIGSQKETIEQNCQKWMSKFFHNFKPNEKKTYTFKQLYATDITSDRQLINVANQVHGTLWTQKKNSWLGQLPDGWTKHSSSGRSFNVIHPSFPDKIFKFCSGSPGGGYSVPGAHFLRVPKGKEIKEIINQENLDEIEVVDEQLIALKEESEIKKLQESVQCFDFVVISKKLDLLNPLQTVERIKSYPLEKQIRIAEQMMQIICRSGLGDVGFHNFGINQKTNRLVIFDTEPLYGSLVLDEQSEDQWQYVRNNDRKEKITNKISAQKGLNGMIEACSDVPVFVEVAQIYRDVFNQTLEVNTHQVVNS